MDTTGNPVVSFVVPCYNVAGTLPQALSSAVQQTLPDIEIVCVDDASTDATPRLLDAWAGSDGRLRVVTHPENRGYGASMNDGISTARGEWVAILEPDDWVRCDMARTLVNAASAAEEGPGGGGERSGSVDVVKAPYLRVGGLPGPAALSQCAYRRRVEPVGEPFVLGGEKNAQLFRQHPSIWSAIYRRGFLEDAAIRFPEHPGSGWADNEFFYRTLLGARSIVYVDQPFYCYREDDPAQVAEALRRDPTLALRRWLDLDDVVRAAGVDDEALLAAHTARAFDYLLSTVDAGVGDLDEVAAARDAVFERLDEARVVAEPSIEPALKHAFAASRNVTYDADAAERAFRSYRRREFAYMVTVNGPAFALRHLAAYLAR